MASKRPRTSCRLSEIEHRGWTSELIRIHLPAHHAWYPCDLVNQIEQTDAWQDDLAYAHISAAHGKGSAAATQSGLVLADWINRAFTQEIVELDGTLWARLD